MCVCVSGIEKEAVRERRDRDQVELKYDDSVKDSKPVDIQTPLALVQLSPTGDQSAAVLRSALPVLEVGKEASTN